jgi:hypothetical protein
MMMVSCIGLVLTAIGLVRTAATTGDFLPPFLHRFQGKLCEIGAFCGLGAPGPLLWGKHTVRVNLRLKASVKRGPGRAGVGAAPGVQAVRADASSESALSRGQGLLLSFLRLIAFAGGNPFFEGWSVDDDPPADSPGAGKFVPVGQVVQSGF